jgi:hypothetical protein
MRHAGGRASDTSPRLDLRRDRHRKGGHFVVGRNPVFNNMDFVLQELPDVRLVRAHDPVTDTVEMTVEAVSG